MALFRLQLGPLCSYLALQDLWPLSMQLLPQFQRLKRVLCKFIHGIMDLILRIWLTFQIDRIDQTLA